MSKVEIRPARPADCAALLELIWDHAHFERCVATINENALAALLGRDNAPVMLFVADQVDNLQGYAAVTFDYSLWRASRWAHLDCLFVREEARGRGTGARLLAHVQEVARMRGADRLQWQTPDWNARGKRFYRRHGAEHSPKAQFHLSLK